MTAQAFVQMYVKKENSFGGAKLKRFVSVPHLLHFVTSACAIQERCTNQEREAENVEDMETVSAYTALYYAWNYSITLGQLSSCPMQLDLGRDTS